MRSLTLMRTSILIVSIQVSLLPWCLYVSTDFTCTRYTASGDVQLTEGEPIMVRANTLQSITCTNRTAEIIDITYKFTPSNAVVRMTKDYIPLYKYELKFIMNCSAALTVQGLNETTKFNANYTLEINIQVKGTCTQDKNFIVYL